MSKNTRRFGWFVFTLYVPCALGIAAMSVLMPTPTPPSPTRLGALLIACAVATFVAGAAGFTKEEN